MTSKIKMYRIQNSSNIYNGCVRLFDKEKLINVPIYSLICIYFKYYYYILPTFHPVRNLVIGLIIYIL